MTKALVGIRGALQAGKDTTGQFLIQQLGSADYKVERKSFADNLKEAVALIFGFHPNYVFSDHFKTGSTNVTRLEVPGEQGVKKLTGRELLQFFGTEICRSMDYNCWARGPINHFKQNDVDIGIITDLRFPNEVRVLRDEDIPSFIIKIERPGFEGDGHASERSLDYYDGDDFIIINDGTLEDLERSTLEVSRQIIERVCL